MGNGPIRSQLNQLQVSLESKIGITFGRKVIRMDPESIGKEWIACENTTEEIEFEIEL